MSRRLLGQVVAVGFLSLGAVAAQTPVRPASASFPSVDSPATQDLLGALLAEGRAGYGKLRDYSCTFTRQERIHGVLSPEQVAVLQVRAHPFSVHLRFARPEGTAGLEMIYVERRRPDGKMKYRPAGVAGVGGLQAVDVNDPKVLASCRRPVNQLGISGVLDILAGVAARERAIGNPIEVFTSDYAFAGRPATRYELFTRRPHAHRVFHRAVIYVDKDLKVPVRYEAYGQPRNGESIGELLEAYSFSDLKPNVGLGDSAFPY